jgi:hypothetical protein
MTGATVELRSIVPGMDNATKTLTAEKFATDAVPSGTENIVINWGGQGIIQIGYGPSFNVWFAYEGGQGATTALIQINNNPPQTLAPGYYTYNNISSLGVQANVNPNNPAKFGWIFL